MADGTGPIEHSKKAKAGPVAAEVLRKYIERIERLEEEKKALSGDIREIYAEAKGNGYEPRVMRKVVSLRKMNAADREEEEALLEVYRAAVGV
ncbi:MAG TPA: DUF2312 domain-containing protein [Alphaproteobacteria bacterium]|jgi:uncharacterized protein (UPF0335 family)